MKICFRFIELLYLFLGMNQNSVKVIGIKDESRKVANLLYINQVEGLKGILKGDFNEWSNFDSWENISFQKWNFSWALEVYKGMKIDIKCDCFEQIDFIPNNFENIKQEKCFGKKVLS